MGLPRQNVVALLVTLAFAACGGGDSPTDPGGNNDGDGTGSDLRVIKAAPSFSADIQEIITRIGCSSSSCHGSGQGNLTLGTSSAANYAALVGVTSTNSGEVYVIAGDAQNSYLVKKLEGRQGSGNGVRMPQGSSALDNIDITNIKNWINNGAPNN